MLNVQLIKKTMRGLGLTGKDVGDACGVTKEAASNWLKGESMPRPSKLIDLAALLKLPVEQLFCLLDPAAHGLDSHLPLEAPGGLQHVQQFDAREELSKVTHAHGRGHVPQRPLIRGEGRIEHICGGQRARAQRRTPLPNTIPLVLSDEFAAHESRRQLWEVFCKRARVHALPLAEVVMRIRVAAWPWLKEAGAAGRA